MVTLTTHAAWILLAAFAMSLAYEAYRATLKAGTSRHDSTRAFLQQTPLYLVAAGVIVALFLGSQLAAWLGLAFTVLMIVVSVFYYNPVIMMDRQPKLVDWFEDLVFTGLLFAAATILVYDLWLGTLV